MKTAENLLLITDAISAAGLGNGDYELGGLKVVVQDGVARLKEGNSLAGSTLTMIDAFRFVVNKVGLSVEEASRLASGNPARQLGISDSTGSIANGKLADLLLVTPDLRIERVWVAGNPIFSAQRA
jgi:N-acetylglucosamine-6-phosphate deacetylase